MEIREKDKSLYRFLFFFFLYHEIIIKCKSFEYIKQIKADWLLINIFLEVHFAQAQKRCFEYWKKKHKQVLKKTKMIRVCHDIFKYDC